MELTNLTGVVDEIFDVRASMLYCLLIDRSQHCHLARVPHECSHQKSEILGSSLGALDGDVTRKVCIIIYNSNC